MMNCFGVRTQEEAELLSLQIDKECRCRFWTLICPQKIANDNRFLTLTNDTVFLQASQMSEEMSKELHLQAQEKLAQYLLRNSLDRGADQRRQALLAQVNTDAELLMSMCLSQVTVLATA